ncbi:MerR family transcriptional regulator [Asticcacaulis sp. DXS10W]|uniref:MerR family transcriptional regulator n=1 Tax=Asticcacaulis currens TaxID=2984210 RepID=A0ABT5IJ16_9CAUL|nr:MerR family transcriptional regulator [Asticcacaulis currens]MDC7696159.1 MerR family transcriptional regulator [Asticcacaulis currens]
MITIGELAKRANCTVPTIRYYESMGLMPEPQRRESGHRAYDRGDLSRLILIRRCRDFDMPLEKIKDLLEMEGNGKPCQETVAFFETQRSAIKARITALNELDFTLSLYVNRCQSSCMQTDNGCDIYEQMATDISHADKAVASAL